VQICFIVVEAPSRFCRRLAKFVRTGTCPLDHARLAGWIAFLVPALQPRRCGSPVNPSPDTNDGSSDWETIEAFAEVLNRAGYASPIRTPRGRAVLAACRQLRSESVKAKASERLKARVAEKAASAES
jgi:hypothetical protein